MKADEQRQARLLATYRRMLADLNRVGPVSESREDLEGFGEVKDYLLDRIEVCAARSGGAA